ncbi:hypothetical protein HYW82_02415 [Candidatus Peregrinibacteria bacterium]|nr:hypothetical protein [Candidatus Peregrinibacteria bacterium]
MNYSEIQNAVRHILKTSSCLHCKTKFKLDDVQILATTKTEGLFDLICNTCHCSTIVTMLLSPKQNSMEIKKQENTRVHQSISQNDILDIKNFLSKFDGNFKKLFTSEQ